MQADLLDRLLVTLAVRLHAFSICQLRRGWRLSFDPYQAITIHFVLRGSGSVRVGNGRWEPFGPRSIILVPARQPHSVGEPDNAIAEVQATDTCTLHGDGLVTFTAGKGEPDTLFICGQIPHNYGGAFGLFNLFQSAIVQPLDANPVIRAAFDQMLAEVVKPGLATQAMVEVLMKQSLIVLLRRHLAGLEASSPMLASLKDPRMARAVVAVLEQPGAPYTVESLAALAGMSRTSFADRFSQVFGHAPMTFVQRVRLRIAARLLTTTDLPVKVVATTIGYASRSAFSRVFEEAYGVAPTDYRQFGGQEEAEPQAISRMSDVET